MNVSLSPKPGSDKAEVTLKLDDTAPGSLRGSGRVEVRADSGVESRAQGPARSYPVTGGQAKIPDVKRGEKLRVTLIADGEASLSGDMTVEDGNRLELTDQVLVKGRAVFPDGAPAANQNIVATLYGANQEPETTELWTRSDGAFDFKAVSGHDVLLELRPKDAEGAMDIAPVVEHKPILDASAPWDLGSVTFEREVPIAEGTVEDEQGAPVPNASVLVLPLDLPIRALAARSDDSGHFAVKGPPNVGPIEIFGSTDEKAGRAPAALAKGATGVKVRLGPPGSVRGRVASPASSLNPVLKIELRTDLRNLYTTTQVHSDGTFEFPHVPAGRYSIVVVAPDTRSEMVSGFDVPAGGASSDQRLGAVPVPTDLVSATLRVMEPSGEPIRDARVDIALSPTATLRVRTDQAGKAEVVAPTNASVPISVEASGYAPYRDAWDGKRAVTLSVAAAESAASRGVERR